MNRCSNFPPVLQMDIRNWHKSRSKSVRFGQKFFWREYESNPRWLIFWRKNRGAKKKNSSSSVPMPRASYDPNTYLQNFNEGSIFTEPDYLSRSFSARYADPSWRFLKDEEVYMDRC
ncbi:unnamed protein product [Ilex paraguariensis]|uniref:Uncharacterized protein n=1 Tax=Ilex paraguariensis TaxID=185542 RepID=A0ABC8TQ32_9AQUA